MKKSILILCACAAFAGCSEDDLVVKKPAVPGSEVQFGATAYMSNGNGTRTAYGDAVGNQIELRWVAGDKIDIACPQAAAGRRKAAYEIVETSIVEDTPEAVNNGKATQLQKLGEYGIQWGEPGNHDFYALYPSSQSFTSDERGKIGMVADGVNGYLPVNQDPKKVTPDGNNFILEPDMRYAFMVAKKSVNSAAEGFNGVSLQFAPLVTALQFELTAPVIDAGNTTGAKDLTITSVSLYSSKGTNICGNFNYKFATGALTETNEETGYNRITMTLPDGVVLTGNSGNKADVTFFLLPTANIESGDLRLQVFYTYKGSPFVKSLKIGKQLTAKKKYYFRNVQLPEITSTVEGSSWFSALDPNVLISQLSIPVAGNAFSSYYEDTSTDPAKNQMYYREQSLHYTDLWNKGVRGFEFVTAHGKSNFDNSTSGTLENNRFVCNKTALEVTAADGTTVTFGNAFRKLASQLDVEGFKNECLIVICTYRTYGNSGNNCQQYVNDLEAWLGDEKNSGVRSKLVQLTPTSTVGQLRGHIAIIVKPGEDAYSSKKTSEITTTGKYPLTIVHDWGTCCDKWNRRFGPDYAIQGAFAETGQEKVEDYLWGVSGSKSTPFTPGTNGRPFQDGYPQTSNYQFVHTTNISGGNVHVQDWNRIVPTNSFATSEFYSLLSDRASLSTDYYYLWLRWPESFSQKQDMIRKTVAASMATMGGSTDNKLFINSLCGFYPVYELKPSFYPYNTKYSHSYTTGSGWTETTHTMSFSLDDAGAGGDYETCAKDLNSWFYQYLTELNTENGVLKQGPLGLVMLNHIGTITGGSDNHSLDLVNWIMMNNFKFPLATDNSGDTSMPLKEEETDSDGVLR